MKSVPAHRSDFSEDNILGSDQCRDVRQHMALGHFVHRR